MWSKPHCQCAKTKDSDIKDCCFELQHHFLL
jgi:hypothetical protein